MATNDYLEALKMFGIEPNFWCSEEYFQKAGWQVCWDGDAIYVFDEDVVMLPPIDTTGGEVYLGNASVWATLGTLGGTQFALQFLDYNFIYDPKRFFDLAGGDWQTFRKNSRKFVNRNPDLRLQYRPVQPDDDLSEVLVEWLSEKERVIVDDETMIKYMESGQNVKILTDDNGEVYGVNIWDENYMYINFRYCFCKPGQHLSEYMRLLFYTDPLINKLVNDGGCLDNQELYRFKTKLNPIKVNDIYSYK